MTERATETTAEPAAVEPSALEPAATDPAPADPAATAPAAVGAPAAPAFIEPAPLPAAAAASTAAGPATASAEPAAASSAPLVKTTNITAGQGGVWTVEVGVITGELTLRSELEGGKLTIRVQYLEADEWYVVKGGRATLTDPADLDAVHNVVVGILNRPEG